jgi:arylsulfatase A-like enzyme
MLFFTALFAWSLLAGRDFSAFGVKDASVEKLVFGSFLGEVIWTQATILLGYLAAGYALGALSCGFVVAAARALGRQVGRWRRRFVVALLVLLLHALLLGRSIAEYPQLYTEAYYDRGGFGASLQVWLTSLPLGVFDAVLWTLAALFVAALIGAAWRDRVWERTRKGWAGVAPVRRKVVAASAASAMAVGGAFVFWPEGSSGAGPNVLLLAVDSLRADHLSAYGHGRKTPSIDRIATEGAAFERAFVSLPRTFPSWTTLLTGQWPYHHGIRTMFPTQAERDRAPAALPKALKGQDYQTSAVADYAGDIFTRMDYGFERIDAPYFNFPMLIKLRSFEIHKHLLPYITNSVGRRIFPALRELAQNADPRDLADRSIAELRRLAHSGKFLLTVFFSAAHFPYAAVSPYYRLYANPAYDGPSRYQKLHQLGRGDKLTAADIQQIQDLYDGAVRSVDDQIGRILDALGELGLAKNTYVALFADHGEHLHEAGLGMGHGEHLRGDQALRIPLLLRGPGVPAGRRIRAQVRDIDLAPTLYGRLGIPPASPVDGADLWPLLSGSREDLGLDLFGETGIWFVDDGDEFFQRQRIPYPALTQLGRLDRKLEVVVQERYRDLILVAKHRMVQTARHKLIYIPTRQGVRYELYDFAKDPEQKRDVSAEQPEVVKALKEKLFRWILSEPGVQLRREFVLPAPHAVGSPPVALEKRNGAGG